MKTKERQGRLSHTMLYQVNLGHDQAMPWDGNFATKKDEKISPLDKLKNLVVGNMTGNFLSLN